MADLTLIQGEGKPLRLTYTDDVTGDAIPLTGAAMSFRMAHRLTNSVVVTKTDSDFNKAQAGNGIMDFSLSTTDTNLTPGLYFAEARAYFSSINNDLSQKFTIEIEAALHTLTGGTGLLDGKVTITA